MVSNTASVLFIVVLGCCNCFIRGQVLLLTAPCPAGSTFKTYEQCTSYAGGTPVVRRDNAPQGCTFDKKEKEYVWNENPSEIACSDLFLCACGGDGVGKSFKILSSTSKSVKVYKIVVTCLSEAKPEVNEKWFINTFGPNCFLTMGNVYGNSPGNLLRAKSGPRTISVNLFSDTASEANPQMSQKELKQSILTKLNGASQSICKNASLLAFDVITDAKKIDEINEKISSAQALRNCLANGKKKNTVNLQTALTAYKPKVSPLSEDDACSLILHLRDVIKGRDACVGEGCGHEEEDDGKTGEKGENCPKCNPPNVPCPVCNNTPQSGIFGGQGGLINNLLPSDGRGVRNDQQGYPNGFNNGERGLRPPQYVNTPGYPGRYNEGSNDSQRYPSQGFNRQQVSGAGQQGSSQYDPRSPGPQGQPQGSSRQQGSYTGEQGNAQYDPRYPGQRREAPGRDGKPGRDNTQHSVNPNGYQRNISRSFNQQGSDNKFPTVVVKNVFGSLGASKPKMKTTTHDSDFDSDSEEDPEKDEKCPCMKKESKKTQESLKKN